MASILKVDELRGIASAGDITVTSEGGAATQSLQQGLAKAWTLDETLVDNPNITESTFNVSSTADNGSGDLHISFVNSFSVNDYVGQGTNAGFSVNDIVTTRNPDTNTGRDDLKNFDTAYKDASICYTAFGDLA